MDIVKKINLLLTESVVNIVETPISSEEAENILKTKCKKNFSVGPILFRGNSVLTGEYYLFTGKATRKSADNVPNHYTMLFSRYLNSWFKYPKRDSSLICITNEHTAAKYAKPSGSVYQIIPYDSSGPFGCAGVPDFWSIFADNQYVKLIDPDTRVNLKYLARIFTNFGGESEFINKMKNTSILNALQSSPNTSSYNFYFSLALWYMKKSASSIRNMLDNDFDQLFGCGDITAVVSKEVLSMSVLDGLNKFLAPENSKAHLISSFSSLKSLSNEEVWFDTPAILKKI